LLSFSGPRVQLFAQRDRRALHHSRIAYGIARWALGPSDWWHLGRALRLVLRARFTVRFPADLAHSHLELELPDERCARCACAAALGRLSRCRCAAGSISSLAHVHACPCHIQKWLRTPAFRKLSMSLIASSTVSVPPSLVANCCFTFVAIGFFAFRRRPVIQPLRRPSRLMSK